MSIIEKAMSKLNEETLETKLDSNQQTEHQPTKSADNKSSTLNSPEQKDIADKNKPITRNHITGRPIVDTRVPTDNNFELEKLSVSGLIAPDHTVPFLADEFRRIKRPLIDNAFGKGAALVDDGNIIMVTSSLPGEGKSFTAANLAVSMALEKDITVILVDADVAMSKITKMFDLDKSLGLTELLNDSSLDIGDAIVKTDFPSLSIIPAGKKSVNSAELLSSNDMKKLVTELGERYSNRVIIFDSPPLLATSEAVILSEKMGQILLVVESNRTPKQAVLDAVAMLNKDKSIGLVLNKTRRSFNYGQYSGYYSYGDS